MKEVYNIEGMTCAACSSAVERVTRKLDGVSYSSVNLTTAKLTIEYDEKKVTPQMIQDKVKKAGFKIAPSTVDTSIDESMKLREEKEIKSYQEKKGRLFLAIVCAIPLLYLSMGHMLPIELPLPEFLSMESHPMSFALAQLFLTVPVLLAGSHFYRNGVMTLLKGNPNMDTLVALGTSSAFLYSIAMTASILKNKNHVHHLYYESAAVVVTLVMLGKFLESRSKRKTTQAIKGMMELAPDTAILYENGVEREINANDLKVGDYVVVKAGTRVPIDGIVVEGNSCIDESMLTGESLPVEKSEKDTVIGGSQNLNGMLIVRTTSVGEDTTLLKIVRLMEEAQGKKAPISKVADKVAGVFVPIVMSIAVIAAIIWLILGYSFSFSLTIFVAVLVIACPCALGLATPTAIMVGTGLGATHGILIKSGEALEITHSIDTVVLDKTGTITEGRPKIAQVVTLKRTQQELLRIAASVEKGSEHPLAKAIVDGYHSYSQEGLYSIQGFVNKSGMGVQACLTETNEQVLLGNHKLINQIYSLTDTWNDKWNKEAEQMAMKGQTPIFVMINNEIEGVIGIADSMKVNSVAAIDRMKQKGLSVYMLTGDNRLAAQAIGVQAHVDEVIAEVLPDEKAQIVKSLQEQGHRVMMVGDGINDAPALIQAEVGVAIGSGSDIAIDSADIVLMKSDLMDVYRSISLSKYTIRNVKQNLFWAFFYNTIGIPIAAGLLYPFTGTLLSPMLGGLAMSLSSVCVVSNALRLRFAKID